MKNKNNKQAKLIGIYFILLSFIGSAYSFLNENLKLTGTVGYSKKATDYTYSYLLQQSWTEGEYYYYQFSATVTYKGNKEINSWTIYIPVPDYAEVIGCYDAGSCEITNNTLKVTNASWNSHLTNNSSLSFSFHIKTKDKNYNFSIESVDFKEEEIIVTPPIEVEGIEVNLKKTNSWNNTSQYAVEIINKSNIDLISWELSLKMSTGSTIESIWSANYIIKETDLVLSGLTWNQNIPINSSVSGIGIQITNNSGPVNLEIISFKAVTSNNESVEIIL